MAKVLNLKLGKLGTAKVMWSDCWMDRAPWSCAGKDLPCVLWFSSVVEGARLSWVLLGPVCFMSGKYDG